VWKEQFSLATTMERVGWDSDLAMQKQMKREGMLRFANALRRLEKMTLSSRFVAMNSNFIASRSRNNVELQHQRGLLLSEKGKGLKHVVSVLKNSSQRRTVSMIRMWQLNSRIELSQQNITAASKVKLAQMEHSSYQTLKECQETANHMFEEIRKANGIHVFGRVLTNALQRQVARSLTSWAANTRVHTNNDYNKMKTMDRALNRVMKFLTYTDCLCSTIRTWVANLLLHKADEKVAQHAQDTDIFYRTRSTQRPRAVGLLDVNRVMKRVVKKIKLSVLMQWIWNTKEAKLRKKAQDHGRDMVSVVVKGGDDVESMRDNATKLIIQIQEQDEELTRLRQMETEYEDLKTTAAQEIEKERVAIKAKLRLKMKMRIMWNLEKILKGHLARSTIDIIDTWQLNYSIVNSKKETQGFYRKKQKQLKRLDTIYRLNRLRKMIEEGVFVSMSRSLHIWRSNMIQDTISDEVEDELRYFYRRKMQQRERVGKLRSLEHIIRHQALLCVTRALHGWRSRLPTLQESNLREQLEATLIELQEANIRLIGSKYK